MEENVIVKGFKGDGYTILFIILGIISIIPLIIAVFFDNSELLIPAIVILASFVVSCIALYAFLVKELIVTTKRVVGLSGFGNRVDVPIEKITAIKLGLCDSIEVSTPSAKIVVLFCGNRDNIIAAIEDAICKYDAQKKK